MSSRAILLRNCSLYPHCPYLPLVPKHRSEFHSSSASHSFRNGALSNDTSTATMPRKKYRALDLQQLTLPSRSTTSPFYNTSDAPARHDSFSSQSAGDRLQKLLDPGSSPPLELPDTCILTSSSRRALELLRFGSLSTSASSTSSKNEGLSLEHSPRLPFLLDTDFPPLNRSSSNLRDSVDDSLETRLVTSPERLQRSRSLEPISYSFLNPRTRSWRASPLQTVSLEREEVDPQPTCNSDPVEPTTRFLAEYQATTALKGQRRVFTEPGDRRGRNDMASAFPQMSGDARRHYPSGSNRYENRPPVNRQTPCKNGPLCRKFQEGSLLCACLLYASPVRLPLTGTCPFNHDFSSSMTPANGLGTLVIPLSAFFWHLLSFH